MTTAANTPTRDELEWRSKPWRVDLGDLAPVPELVAQSLAGVDRSTARFPRSIVQTLGSLGVFRHRYEGEPPGNILFGVAFAEEFARQVVNGGVVLGLGLHSESAMSIMARYSTASDYVAQLYKQMLDGSAIGCIGATEAGGGSDLMGATQCLAVPVDDGWRINGKKKYISLGSTCDFSLIVVRVATVAGEPTGRLGLVIVPREQMTIVCEHDTIGLDSCDTVAVDFEDVLISKEGMIGKPGLGIGVISYGLSFERLSAAAQLVGISSLVVELAVEHAGRRMAFGVPLRKHQYLELRLAEAWTEIEILRRGVHDFADQLTHVGLVKGWASTAAAFKMRAARTAERVVSDCMQAFGGSALLAAETPFGEILRDVRVARIGGGADEVMLSMVAADLEGNPRDYERLIHIPSS